MRMKVLEYRPLSACPLEKYQYLEKISWSFFVTNPKAVLKCSPHTSLYECWKNLNIDEVLVCQLFVSEDQVGWCHSEDVKPTNQSAHCIVACKLKMVDTQFEITFKPRWNACFLNKKRQVFEKYWLSYAYYAFNDSALYYKMFELIGLVGLPKSRNHPNLQYLLS
jgi:hypothetical protein